MYRVFEGGGINSISCRADSTSAGLAVAIVEPAALPLHPVNATGRQTTATNKIREQAARIRTPPEYQPIGPMGLLLERHRHLGITPRFRTIHSRRNVFTDQPDHGPLRMFQHYQRELAVFKVLLISNIPVSCDHRVKPCLLGDPNQLPIFELVPPSCPSFLNGMTDKEDGQTAWSAVIK
jgi:hypothetical protein